MYVRFSRMLTPLLLAVVGLLPTLATATAQSPAPAAPIIGTVMGAKAINIRACPRLDCNVLFSARLGETIEVTGAAVDGWLPVSRDGAAGFAYALYVQHPDRPPVELRQGAPGCQRVAFIFNIGVGYPAQMDLLKWMRDHSVPATMFVMGWWTNENRDLVRQMDQLGFPVGSHGNERLELPKRGDAEAAADIQAAAKAIEAAIGKPPAPYLTPYAAAIDDRTRSIVARAGFLPVGWEVSADDWDFNISPDDVFMRVVPNVVDGSIVEFHLDAPSSAESTAVAIPWIVERLRAKGYSFVTVPDMALPCPSGVVGVAPTPGT
ncbi:MAG: polysaccharide deacetylase family protein [Thermomicrobiales bacterium]|nr:polysaccharide deacetylase family protein [Thermomicrobiales bacterium]